MDTNFWVISTTHGPYRVSEETAELVRAEVARYAGKPYMENKEITFIDLAGSHAFIVLATYLGVLESTKEQREWDRQMNLVLDKEKEDDEPSWK